MKQITHVIASASFSIVSVVLDKNNPGKFDESVYGYLMRKGLERVFEAIGPIAKKDKTFVIVEARGTTEDRQLELEFRRTCSGQNKWRRNLPFEIQVASKQSNCEGLQLSDLIARPIGTTHLHPENKEKNRPYQTIKKKFVTASDCDFKGEGIVDCSCPISEKQKGN